MERRALVDELTLPVVGEQADLGLLEVAIAIEDVFDVVLADDEITAANLGTRTAVLQLLDRHLGDA